MEWLGMAQEKNDEEIVAV